METLQHFDVAIVGAGVAGGIMAAYLGKQGRLVAVVEKSLAEPDRIIGELLQPGGVELLQRMGLQEVLEGFDAVEIRGYGLFLQEQQIQISYREGYTGRGFRNGKFVQRIREILRQLPTVSLMEGQVQELLEENGRITGYRYLPTGTEVSVTINAPLTIVADGMFSSFRAALSENEKKVSSYFMGLILKHCELPYANCGHVVVAEPSPVLCYPISSTETRVLIDFPQAEAPRRSPELTQHLQQVIAPQLPEAIRPSFLIAVNEGKFKVMPNHLIPARPIRRSGAVLLGDSLNMRHPLTGGGMTVALTDCLLLGEALLQEKEITAAASDVAVEQFYAQRHESNATINILADALYGVMSDTDLKAACFSYLNRGGVHAEQPIDLLSAVSRDRGLLLRHFFAVAFMVLEIF